MFFFFLLYVVLFETEYCVSNKTGETTDVFD